MKEMKQQIGIFEVQRILKAYNLYAGDIDGDLGPKTQRGVFIAIREFKLATLPSSWESWILSRKCVLAVQVLLHQNGYSLDVGSLDGYAGPSTLYAYSLWAYKQLTGRNKPSWRKDDVRLKSGSALPKIAGAWGTQKDVERRFGKAGGPQCTAGVIHLPFPMVVAWNTRQKISTIRCHEDIADSAQKVFDRIHSAYSPGDIQSIGIDLFGGCYNYRLKRGGKTLSTHAYGVAFDFDPLRNQLRWNKTRARLGKSDAALFFKLWKEEGFRGLGPEKDYDWMHIQAPSL